MKTVALCLLLLLSGFAPAFSRAEPIQFAPGFGELNAAATEQQPTPVPLASGPNAFTDFQTRIKTAVDRRDWAAFEGLYQTNAVTAVDLKRELARWQPLLAPGAGSELYLYFKELGTLPTTAHQFWSGFAQRLTTHKVTHLVHVQNTVGTAFILPLVEVDGRLWIVPSDKIPPGTDLKTGAVVNRNLPAR